MTLNKFFFSISWTLFLLSCLLFIKFLWIDSWEWLFWPDLATQSKTIYLVIYCWHIILGWLQVETFMQQEPTYLRKTIVIWAAQLILNLIQLDSWFYSPMTSPTWNWYVTKEWWDILVANCPYSLEIRRFWSPLLRQCTRNTVTKIKEPSLYKSFQKHEIQSTQMKPVFTKKSRLSKQH